MYEVLVLFEPSEQINRHFCVQLGLEVWVQQLLGPRGARLVGSLLGRNRAFIAVVPWEELAGARWRAGAYISRFRHFWQSVVGAALERPPKGPRFMVRRVGGGRWRRALYPLS
jgi:hypothetical protein